MIECKLPSLGAEMDEGTLLEWKVRPGDPVKKGQVVAVVETSKSAIDVEIWQDGTVYELALAAEQTVPVGTVMLRLLEPGETPEHAEAEKRRLQAEARAASTPSPADAGIPGPATSIPDAGITSGTASAAESRTSRGTPSAGAATAATEAARAAPDRRPRVSPVARRRAGELGIDVSRITGTGPAGAVTMEDVEKAAVVMAAAETSTQEKPAAVQAAPKNRGLEMRAAIAAAMARSKREIPHYYLATEVPLARASAWLAARNAGRPITGRVLMAVPMLRAVALALKKYPEFNGFFQDGAFVPGAGIHLGVAISLRQGGLIAPAIRDADALGLDDLMRALTDLVARARALSLRSSEIGDATVTVTNLGEQGVEVVHGVIYPPQVALVGFGKVTERPWAQDGQVIAAPVVTLTLAADHRASDGHRGALFLAEIARRLESPELLELPEGRDAGRA